MIHHLRDLGGGRRPHTHAGYVKEPTLCGYWIRSNRVIDNPADMVGKTICGTCLTSSTSSRTIIRGRWPQQK